VTVASLGRWVARRGLGCLVVLAFGWFAWQACDHPARKAQRHDLLQYGDQDGGVLAGVFQADSRLHDWNGDGVLHPDHVYGSGVEASARDWDQEPPAHWRDRWFRPAGASITEVPLVLWGSDASFRNFGAYFGLVGFPPGAIDAPQPGFEWLARALISPREQGT